MNAIIQDLIIRGVELTVSQEGDFVVYTTEGFYKSGDIQLFVNPDGSVEAKARYNEYTPITNFDDLVRLNFKWWSMSKDRADFWKTPNSFYQPHFERLDLANDGL